MVSRSVLIFAAAAAVRAQTIETSSASSVAPSSTVSQVMPPAATQGFNLANVSSSDEFAWCHSQLNTCPQICGGAASANFCDQSTLTFSCTCPNGTVPDCTAFTGTVPFFVCQANFGQCIANHPNDAEGQSQCTANMKCGTRNATAEALAQTSASSMPTSTAASSASGGAGGASQTASQSAAAATSSGAAAGNSQHVATGATAALLLAAMKLFL